jgi:hypothetical protein
MRRHLAFFLCAALAACRQQSPEQKLLKDVDPAASWMATLQFAGEQWLANSVPTRFVRATVHAAQKDLKKTTRTVDESQASQSLRDTVRHQIDVTTAAAAAVDRAVQDNDRRTVAISVQRFAAAHEVLRKLEDTR